MSQRSPGIMERALVAAAALGLRRPAAVLSAAGVLVILSVASGLGMRFHAEITDLVPAASADAFRRLEDVFGAGDNAFLLVTSRQEGAEGALVAFAEAFAARLEKEPLVRSVSFGWAGLAERLLSGGLLSHAPLFATRENLEALDKLLTPEGIAARVRKQSASLGLPGIGEAEKWVERDPLELREFFLPRLAAMRGAFRTQPGSIYFLSEDGHAVLVWIEGTTRSSDIPGVKSIVASIWTAAVDARASLAERKPEVLHFETMLTGGYAFAAESEQTLRGDLTRNIICSLVLVLWLFGYTLRRPMLVLAAVVPLAAGTVMGFGLFSCYRREVVTLALVSGAILAGLGIDFVIHIAVRVFSDTRGPTREAVIDGARATGPSLLFAALTTAGAFLSFPLTGEKFLGDLGVLSACGILCCMAATQILFPASITPWVRAAERGGGLQSGARVLLPRGLGSEQLAAPGIDRPRTVLFGSIGLGIAATVYLALSPPGLETDLRNVQAAGSKAVAAEERIAALFGGAPEPVLLLVEALPRVGGSDPAFAAAEEAAQAAARLEAPLRELRARGLVAAWSSPAQLVPPVEEGRAALEIIARKDPRALEQAFVKALEDEGFEPARFEGAVGALRGVFELRRPPEAGDLRRLGLDAEIGRMLGERDGKGYALITVQPAREMWTTRGQEELFGALERAAAAAGVKVDLAGLHVVSARSAGAVVSEFCSVTVSACIAVALLVLALFRRPGHACLALLPVTLGTLWTAALCGLLGYKLNFMNAGILPMIVGIGVDDGIHMVKQYLDSPERSARLVVRSTGSAVMLTSLTTLAAFGTMAFSENRGLASVGAVSGIGVTACLLASIVSLPAALELHSRRRKR